MRKAYVFYWCERCHHSFLAPFGNTQVSRTVQHSEGDCCHYGEAELDWNVSGTGS